MTVCVCVCGWCVCVCVCVSGAWAVGGGLQLNTSQHSLLRFSCHIIFVFFIFVFISSSMKAGTIAPSDSAQNSDQRNPSSLKVACDCHY